MDIDRLIAQLEDIRKEYGNLSVFHDEGWQFQGFKFIKSKRSYPKDWNMPNKFVIVNNPNS
jgi:hypothetical protein